MRYLDGQVPVLEGVKPDQIPFDQLFAAEGPIILRGLVSDWSLVKAGEQSPGKAMEILQSHSSKKPVGVYIAPPEAEARFFYNQDCTGFNYQSKYLQLSDIFAQIREAENNPDHSYYYMNSLTLDNCFPGLRADNDLSFDHQAFTNNQPLSKVWVGTESIAAAHYDVPSNLACCVLGARRFTLFPPEQIHNLYPGPLEPTPGGQVITMVDLKNPDFERFPRVRRALEAAVVVDLQPGDAVYYPSMWWHQVEAIGELNTLINYWFRDPAGAEHHAPPLAALQHAMLAFKDLEPNQKETWQALFDYYVFNHDPAQFDHIPKAARGILNPIDQSLGQTIRSTIRRLLR